MVRTVLDDFQPTQQEIDYFGYYSDGWHAPILRISAEATFFDIHQDKDLVLTLPQLHAV